MYLVSEAGCDNIETAIKNYSYNWGKSLSVTKAQKQSLTLNCFLMIRQLDNFLIPTLRSMLDC